MSNCATCGPAKEPLTLVISSVADLEHLARLRRRYSALRVALPSLDRHTNKAIEDEFQRYYLECGCTAGGYAMVASGAVTGGLIGFHWYVEGTAPLTFTLWAAGAVLASMVLAKTAAIHWARRRLRRATRRLAETLTSREFGGEPVAAFEASDQGNWGTGYLSPK